MIQYGQLNRMLPVLESLLANTKNRKTPEKTLVKSLIGKAAL